MHTNVTQFLDGFRHDAHPMGMLLGAIAALSTFYPDAKEIGDEESRRLQRVRLIAKFPTIAAWVFRHSRGLPYVFPRNDLDYIGNFVNMTFEIGGVHEPNPVLQRALEILLVLHADHEQNASTNAVRGVGSTQVDPFSAVSAGIAALYGPLHGGANEQVLRMLDEIGDVKNVPAFIEGVKNHERLLMGFGHRVYKNYDPRAKLIKRVADDVFAQTGVDPKLEIALELERIALEDDYFVSRKLYPNVDFYSGIIYRAMGYPTDYFTVLFALGRLPGWLAQWEEMLSDPEQKIARPRQIYTGYDERDFVPIAEPLAAELHLSLVARGRGGVLVDDLPGAVGVLAEDPVRRLFIERSSVPSGDTAANVVNALTAATSSPAWVRTSSNSTTTTSSSGERAEPLRDHRAERVLAVVRPHAPEIERADVVGVEPQERIDVLRADGGGVGVEHLLPSSLLRSCRSHDSGTRRNSSESASRSSARERIRRARRAPARADPGGAGR